MLQVSNVFLCQREAKVMLSISTIFLSLSSSSFYSKQSTVSSHKIKNKKKKSYFLTDPKWCLASFWFYLSLEICTLEICCCLCTTEVNELLFSVLTALNFTFVSVSADCLPCGRSGVRPFNPYPHL